MRFRSTKPAHHRRRHGQNAAALEWHYFVIFGAALFLALSVVVPFALFGTLNPPEATARVFKYAGEIACCLCWWRGFRGYLHASSRERLLRRQTGLESIQGIGWAEFEKLVGEVYRQWGYKVEETGLGGADGGIDLRLRKRGELTLVQCKHWKTKSVGAPQVREMFGLMVHHQAQAIAVVTSGTFTKEARSFVAGKPIELIDGKRLAKLIERVNG